MTNSILKSAIIVAGAALPFIATPALADEYDDAGGFYVGVSAGYGWSTADVTTSTVFDATGYFATTSVPAINASGVQRVKPKAFNGGVNLGYDYNTGGVLVGVVADISSLSNTKNATATAVYPCCSPSTYTVSQTVNTKWLTTARAKLGIGVGGGSSVYATGGWAGEKVKYTALFTDTFATANETATKDAFRSGWVVGGGASFRFGNGWSIDPEYLHAEFGTLTVPGGTLTAFTPSQSFAQNPFTHTMKLRTDVARINLNYHF